MLEFPNQQAAVGMPMQEQPDQARMYLRSKLKRVQKEPEVNKLLMLVNLLRGRQ